MDKNVKGEIKISVFNTDDEGKSEVKICVDGKLNPVDGVKAMIALIQIVQNEFDISNDMLKSILELVSLDSVDIEYGMED